MVTEILLGTLSFILIYILYYHKVYAEKVLFALHSLFLLELQKVFVIQDIDMEFGMKKVYSL